MPAGHSSSSSPTAAAFLRLNGSIESHLHIRWNGWPIRRCRSTNLNHIKIEYAHTLSHLHDDTERCSTTLSSTTACSTQQKTNANQVKLSFPVSRTKLPTHFMALPGQQYFFTRSCSVVNYRKVQQLLQRESTESASRQAYC